MLSNVVCWGSFGGKTFNNSGCVEIKRAVVSTSNKKEENTGASTHRDKPIYHLRTNLIESKDGDK